MKLYVVFSTTQNPRKQPPGVVLKKRFLKNVEVSFLIKLQETPSQVVSREFCEILKNTYFVTSQGLPLNPRTYNTRSLETTTIAKNVTSINLFEEQY